MGKQGSVAKSFGQRQREAGVPPAGAAADPDAWDGLNGSSPASAPADLTRLKRYFTEHEQLTYEARRNSLIAIDYYDSDQFSREELATLHERGQPPIVINRIKPAINGMIGVSERGRSDPKAWPRNPADANAADAATDVLRFIADAARFKRTKLDIFRDMLVPGTGAALVGVDSDAQVTITQIRWEEFFYDPRSRRADFKDARYLGIAKWMYADDLTAMYPDDRDTIEASVQASGGAGMMIPDESFQDRPLQGPGTGGAWIDPKLRRLLVVEMYWRGDQGWSRSVFTGTDVLEHGPSPYLDHKGRPDCPIEAQSAYVRRDNGRYGAVWDMIGPQNEVNKRRARSVHLLSVSRVEARNPNAVNVDSEVVRREAARPDGVLPYGWGLSPNTTDFQGNIEMMAEAKAEIERMGPNPAVLGRTDHDASGRALLARQQSGLVELANLYGAIEDFELRVYRQCWARAKQFWRAPQFIRVTDDDNAPRFVGLNQPIYGQAPPNLPRLPGLAGAAPVEPGGGTVILGYRNAVAEMDVDIEVDVQQDVGNLQQEAFGQILDLVKMSPVYQQQITLKQLILLSPIPHKRSVIDAIDQASQTQQAAQAQQQQIARAHAMAQIERTRTEAQRNTAEGTARMLNALSEAHAVHAEHAAAGFEAGLSQANSEQAQAATQRQVQGVVQESAPASVGAPPPPTY
jgi:hypothetical protein